MIGRSQDIIRRRLGDIIIKSGIGGVRDFLGTDG